MIRERLKKIFPSWQNSLLALLAAGLLILAFPDFEYWFLAWFALVPLMWAVERERSVARSFLLGWLFGTAFFFGTCWWLTYAPIHYAAMPSPLAYLLILIVCLGAGVFLGFFAGILALLLRRFGYWGFVGAPFVWVTCEFARYWITGNNWNAIGYSLAWFQPWLGSASVAGVYAPSFQLVGFCSIVCAAHVIKRGWSFEDKHGLKSFVLGLIGFGLMLGPLLLFGDGRGPNEASPSAHIVALQPIVPMSGLDQTKWRQLQERQIELAETEIAKLRTTNDELPTTVILPESPMNFAYEDDPEFRKYIGEFAARNNVSVLFNSSQPDKTNGRYFNSAVMVGPDGKLTAQYDKVYLLPFGEAVPPPLENIVPAFVGHFSYGSKYDLMPLGDAKAGVMICFESHFGELGRRYVQNGADAIIEMTNDGYLGPTPVLRQHLANAVFRAVETNRPVLRVTNIGITAYIDERGNVLDPLPSYTEGTRVWTVSKSDGSQTFYVKYGDWFAWLCAIVTILLVAMSFKRKTG